VCWLGELLTEKYNPGGGEAIGEGTWKTVHRKALSTEWNNTVLNLVRKARGAYVDKVAALFSRSDVPFRIDAPWCAYLYLNGVIDAETASEETGEEVEICRFSSPFVQERIFNALTDDMAGDRLPVPALEPLDDLEDVLAGDELDLPALLSRYAKYLDRSRERGLDPWKGQPRRADLRLTEAAGHFHLYAWLREAVGRWCVVAPELPTGNGKVDLHLRCGKKTGIVEVKSYVDQLTFLASMGQAARYARSSGLDAVTLVVFVPVRDEEVVRKLSGPRDMDGTRVNVVAVPWV